MKLLEQRPYVCDFKQTPTVGKGLHSSEIWKIVPPPLKRRNRILWEELGPNYPYNGGDTRSHLFVYHTFDMDTFVTHKQHKLSWQTNHFEQIACTVLYSSFARGKTNKVVISITSLQVSTELEFVKLNPIAVLMVLQNRYSQSCIAIGFRRCYVINKSRSFLLGGSSVARSRQAFTATSAQTLSRPLLLPQIFTAIQL
jgi:hypothetical protein